MTSIYIKDETVFGFIEEGKRRGWDRKETNNQMNVILSDALGIMRKERLAAPELKPMRVRAAPKEEDDDLVLRHPSTGKRVRI